MPLIPGSKSKILAKGRAKGGPLHSLDDQEWMKELKGGGFTRKCIAYIMDVSTEWLRYMERKYGLMVDRDSRYANRKEAIARKRIAWEKAQKELVAAKSSLFEEVSEEPAEAVPPGFIDLVDWLTPLGGVADPDELSIHINGLQVLFAGLRSHSSHNNGIRKGDLRRWTERYPKFLLIYEDEWASPIKRPLIKNMILVRTGLAKDLVKLNARDLEPRFLIKKDYQHFLTHHHLEGKVQDRRTKFAIGLFDQSGRLVCCGVILRNPKIKTIELSHFATLQGYLVRGGLSRVIALFKNAYWRTDFDFYVRSWGRFGHDLFEQLGYKRILWPTVFRKYTTDGVTRWDRDRYRFDAVSKETEEAFKGVPKKMLIRAHLGVYSFENHGTRTPIFIIERLPNRRYSVVNH